MRLLGPVASGARDDALATAAGGAEVRERVSGWGWKAARGAAVRLSGMRTESGTLPTASPAAAGAAAEAVPAAGSAGVPGPPSPLADLHRRLGARPAPAGAPAAVAGYGDLDREHRALTGGAALVDRWPVGRLRLTGPDRARFLGGLVTCDVKALGPGRGVYGFFTSVKGRVLADVAVLAFADQLLLELPPGTAAEIAAHLGKYKIADRVEIELADDLAPLTVAGPKAAEALGIEVPEAPWSSVETEIAGVPARLVRQGHLGVDGLTLWVESVRAAALAEALLARAGGELVPAGSEALETVRVEAGIPRFGADFDADNFPQETGLGDEGVSYQKGCYLGQEVVARIHYRGGVNRGLRRLRLTPAGAAPPPGAALLHDGRPAGRLGSAVRSPSTGEWIGLAVLHQRAADAGTVLEIEGGGAAEVQP